MKRLEGFSGAVCTEVEFTPEATQRATEAEFGPLVLWGMCTDSVMGFVWPNTRLRVCRFVFAIITGLVRPLLGLLRSIPFSKLRYFRFRFGLPRCVGLHRPPVAGLGWEGVAPGLARYVSCIGWQFSHSSAECFFACFRCVHHVHPEFQILFFSIFFSVFSKLLCFRLFCVFFAPFWFFININITF